MDDYQRYARRQGCRAISEQDIEAVPLERVVIGRATAAAFASIIAAAKAAQASLARAPADEVRDNTTPASSSDGGAGSAPAQRRISRFTSAIDAARQRVA
jgi:hypothetical protein